MNSANTYLLYLGKGNKDNVTISKYNQWVVEQKQDEIADFIVARFAQRYIAPFKNSKTKHGFAMMACACLLIETLQCFYEGKEKSNGATFDNFFNRQQGTLLQFKAIDFHKNIRSGILHQGETKGGYRILRTGKLLDTEHRTINATKFLGAMETALISYGKQLKSSNWNDEIWNKFRYKMDFIMQNCEVPKTP